MNISRTLLLLSMFFSLSIFGQDEVYSSAKPKAFSKRDIEIMGRNFPQKADTVILLPGKSKEEIYLKAKEWASKFFVDQKNVLQTDDKEGGLIIYKYISTDIFFTKMYINRVRVRQTWACTAGIYIKDGKVRVLIENLNFNHDATITTSGISFGDFGLSSVDFALNLHNAIINHYKGYPKGAREDMFAKSFESAYRGILNQLSATKSFAISLSRAGNNFDF